MDYKKGEDILDIWFDSGVSWASVLEGRSLFFFFLETENFVRMKCSQCISILSSVHFYYTCT